MNLDNLNNTYVFAIIIFFCPLIGKIVKSSIEFHTLSKEYSSSTSLTNSLIRLTQKEFQIWCSEYLSYLGYTDLILSPILSDKGKDTTFILCTKDKTSYYVQCKKNSYNDLIGCEDVENLLGILISKSLYNGVIISTSKLDNSISNLTKILPKEYKINIISLDTINVSALPNSYLQPN